MQRAGPRLDGRVDHRADRRPEDGVRELQAHLLAALRVRGEAKRGKVAVARGLRRPAVRGVCGGGC
jgi:hypothetical protein